MWWAAGKEPDLEGNPVLKWINRRFRIAPGYDGERFFNTSTACAWRRRSSS
jgi:tellurite resistance protein TerC